MFPRCSARLFLCAANAALLVVSAQAATHNVDTVGDDGPGSLRQAVRQSAAGDSIVILIGGEISLTSGEIQISRDLNIQGPTNTKLAIVSSRARAFNIVAGKVNISNVSISGSILGNGGNGRGVDTEGGAVLNSGTLTMTDASVWGSFAAGGNGAGAGDGGTARGGAIANYGSLTLLRCTLYGNSAVGGDGGYGGGGAGGSAQGGAIFNAGSLAMFNATIYGANALGGRGGDGQFNGGAGGNGTGGGIYNAGTFSFTNCTITSNSASGRNGGGGGQSGYGAGGGVFQADSAGISTPRNVIIALNNVSFGTGNSFGPDAAGYIASQGHNLVGRSDGNAGWTAADRLGGTNDGTRVDPRLSALQDNGGSTLTQLPLVGSPVIEAGDDAALVAPIDSGDQRGFPRKVGQHVDIGSIEGGVEQPGPVFTVTTTGEHDDGACSSDDCTLLEAVNRVNASPDANTVNFAPGVTGTISTSMTPQGLAINSPVTINGPGALELSLNGGGEGRVLYNNAHNVVISGLGFRNGRVFVDDGAGIKNVGTLTLIDCGVSSNNAGSPPRGGGAVFNQGGATLTMIRCSLESNFTDRDGGAICNEGILAVTNCTFANNFASNGGGIMSRASGGLARMTLRNCTIAWNTALSGGMGFADGGAGVYAEGDGQQNRVSNSLIAANVSYTFPATNPDVGGNFTSDGHNFIGNAGFSTGFIDGLKGDQVGNIFQPRDPVIARIGYNGGKTNTVALLPGSPAINTGDDSLAMSTDQRSYARSGVSDVGAFEFNGAPAQATLVGAFSRKAHGNSGPIDRSLPLQGAVAVESRSGGSGGNHTVVFRFVETLSNVGSVRFEGAAGRVSASAIGADAHEYVVELAGVTNAQTISVMLQDITDAAGNTASAVSASMGVLLGDANGDRTVNSGDMQATRSRAGQSANADNSRYDFNRDGAINSGDAIVVRSQSGTYLP